MGRLNRKPSLEVAPTTLATFKADPWAICSASVNFRVVNTVLPIPIPILAFHSIALPTVMVNKSSPKSFGNSRIVTLHGRKWTRPLRVLPVQCPLQTSPITQPPVRHIHTAVPHSPSLRYIVLSDSQIVLTHATNSFTNF